jgi:hypothetical protein
MDLGLPSHMTSAGRGGLRGGEREGNRGRQEQRGLEVEKGGWGERERASIRESKRESNREGERGSNSHETGIGIRTPNERAPSHGGRETVISGGISGGGSGGFASAVTCGAIYGLVPAHAGGGGGDLGGTRGETRPGAARLDGRARAGRAGGGGGAHRSDMTATRRFTCGRGPHSASRSASRATQPRGGPQSAPGVQEGALSGSKASAGAPNGALPVRVLHTSDKRGVFGTRGWAMLSPPKRR